jgi:hypothetical protein
MSHPPPPLQGNLVLAAAKVQRFAYHTPQAQGMSWLDLSKLTVKACSRYEEMLQVRESVPVALLGVDKHFIRTLEAPYRRDGDEPEEIEERVSKKIQQLNSFHRRSVSYLAAPFPVLLNQVFLRLAPADRNLAAMVLPNKPVHYYADLDGSYEWCFETDAAEKVRTEFISEFTTHFFTCFARYPDLSRMHWERAVHVAHPKLSLHLHITSESYATHHDLKAFDASFQSHLQKASKCLDNTSFLCRARKENQSVSPTYECLLDSSVYNKNSLLRLNGNCKPYGPMLQYWPLPSASPLYHLSEEELLWRGLPNFSLPSGGEYRYLVCGNKSSQSRQKKRPREEVNYSSSSSSSSSSETKEYWQRVLAPYLGPSVQIQDMKEDDESGWCLPRSAWCVKRRYHDTVKELEFKHSSNRTSFNYNRAQQKLTIRCLDPECNKFPFIQSLRLKEEGSLLESSAAANAFLSIPSARVGAASTSASSASSASASSSSSAPILLNAVHPEPEPEPEEDPVHPEHEEEEEEPEGEETHFHSLGGPLPLVPPIVESENFFLQQVDVDKLVGHDTVDQFIEQYMNRPNSVTMIRSGQGTGKTQLILHVLKCRATKDPVSWRNRRILYVSCRRLFADSLTNRILEFENQHKNEFKTSGVDGFAFANYTNFPNTEEGNQRLRSQLRIILSLESLVRLVRPDNEIQKFDEIILDEIEQLLAIFHSSTINRVRGPAFKLLISLLQQAERVLVADADLKLDSGIRFILEHLGSSKSMAYLFNSRQTIQRNYFFFKQRGMLERKLLESSKKGYKIWVSCNSKAPLIRLNAWLRSELGCKPKSHEMDGDEQGEQEEEEEEGKAQEYHCIIQLITGDSTDKEKKDLVANSLGFKKDIMMASPAVGPGINFDEEHYDEAYMIIGRSTTSDTEVFQQVNRVRQLRQNSTYVYVEGEDKDDECSLSTIRERVLSQLKEFQKKDNNHHIDVSYSGDVSNTGMILQSLPDNNYNAVFLRNEKKIVLGRLRMKSRLIRQMRLAGGTVWEYRGGRNTKESDETVKKLKQLGDDEIVKRSKAIAGAFSKGNEQHQQWSVRRQTNSEEDVLKNTHKDIRTKFSIPDEMELTPKFVELLGLNEYSKYYLLILAAKGGSQQLKEELKIIMEKEYQIHYGMAFEILRITEVLLWSMGFPNLPSFLLGEYKCNTIDIESKENEWIPLFNKIYPKCLNETRNINHSKYENLSESKNLTNTLISVTRSHLKDHFGISLIVKKKQNKNKKIKELSIDPFIWHYYKNLKSIQLQSISIEEEKEEEEEKKIKIKEELLGNHIWNNIIQLSQKTHTILYHQSLATTHSSH